MDLHCIALKRSSLLFVALHCFGLLVEVVVVVEVSVIVLIVGAVTASSLEASIPSSSTCASLTLRLLIISKLQDNKCQLDLVSFNHYQA